MKGLRMTEAELAAIVKRNHPRMVKGPFCADPVGHPSNAERAKPLEGIAPAKPDPGRFSRALARQLRLYGLPSPILEYPFDKQLDGGGRGWSFDLAWPSLHFAVEVDGAVHRIKARFKGDIEKHQKADSMGWRVLRVSPRQVETGAAVELVRAALAGQPAESAP